jgi:hypothetical protein
MGVKLYQQQNKDLGSNGESKENLSQDAAELVTRIKERSANPTTQTITSLASLDMGM